MRREGSATAGTPRCVSSSACTRETLRRWVMDAEVEAGSRPGVPRADRDRVVELERENRELRRANEILKSAAAFFAAELDRRSTR